ncbi:S-adenosyl-L-methionine-dependent methyltransferases superfamily protein [Actinidia rufa]|uniref:S-adenosyl-L-methionine-dependent methyltransferases superfamily protein n=1 Tax=Actinidia rufa TaxID=165716 RepID=A0A7J0FQH7_9ERIC|nr:S-adenosyl-L-methionine-dependent methyltransferases superfamily protein [Actinidia rufa]
MRKPSVMSNFGSWRGMQRLIFIVCLLFLLVCIANISNFYSLRSFLVSDTFCNQNRPPSHVTTVSEARVKVETLIQKVQQEIVDMRDISKNSSSSLSSSFMLRYPAFLADILGLVEEIQAFVEGTNDKEIETEAIHPLARRNKEAGEASDYFLIEEIRKYMRIKPNRLGKQNFMGANATFTSIGHACFSMKQDLEEYMDYDIGEICNDDWKLAQKLMVHGCDPLPRRRCFSRAPQLNTRPFPINESIWKLPEDKNVRWSQYTCKNFTCLAKKSTRKGFFKCSDCFNLTHHEMPRWVVPFYQDPNSNLTADFLISEVLDLKPGEIRIGLDFSVGTALSILVQVQRSREGWVASGKTRRNEIVVGR